MDIIFEFLVEFIFEVLVGVLGELLGAFALLIGIGVVVFEYWPSGGAQHDVLIGSVVVLMTLAVGVLIGRWWFRRTNRPEPSQDALTPQAPHDK